jgi:type IX secretion system PorP/SprF family membrane protein
MKRTLLYILLLLVPALGMAQLHTLSDQYVLNGLAINPAFAGSEDAFSAAVTYRNQWVGFEGAPKTLSAAIHSPLGNERVGLGLLVENDQIGVNDETSIMANYAYLIEMGEGKMALGVGAGVSFLNIDWDNLRVTDENDGELLGTIDKLTNPNFSAGIYYHSKKFFLGVSIPFFLSYAYSSSTKEIDLKNSVSEYNYHLTSGYTFDLSKNVQLTPSFLVKYHAQNAFQVDINTQFIFYNTLWVGLTYRSKDAVAGILQLAVTNQFRVAYSYDFDIGETGYYNKGSHEIMLKFVLDYRARVVGPKRF